MCNCSNIFCHPFNMINSGVQEYKITNSYSNLYMMGIKEIHNETSENIK